MTFVKQWLYVLARYLVSFLIITYGFAKLNGAQFNTLDSNLDKAMGQASGFTLVWYFFGYSKVYGTFIALAQIFGGVLLMFRRTTLLGACILLPVICNIILIDIFFGVNALEVAVVIFGALLYIVGVHRHELINVFWAKQNAIFPATRNIGLIIAKAVVCLLLIVIPYGITYWAANYNNRRPTPLDGVWNVVEASPDVPAGKVPSVVFFEHNMAFSAVFKFGPEKYEEHHFEVESSTQKITIWEVWLKKGDNLFEGTYELSGQDLLLRGHFAGQGGESVLRLRRRQ